MSKKYQIIEKFNGYRTKTDSTKLPAGYLVSGSQNVLSTDGENIKQREGYTLFGQASVSGKPIESSFDWQPNTGLERNLRSHDDELELYDTISEEWKRIKNSWTSVDFQYAVWWDADENKDYLLFVNGDSNIYAWNGLSTQIGATTSNSITLLDTTSTWAENRVNIGGGTVTYDKKITVNGTVYTYTGGETTNTLTGVTPDPSGEASGSLAIGTVTTFANKPGSDATVYPNDLIVVLKNQAWIGSTINNLVYVSKNTDFSSFSFTANRLPGEGAELNLDASPTGFVVQEEDVYISAGTNQWYQSQFVLSDDNAKEALFIKRLKTGEQQSAYSQNAITKTKNDIVFMSKEPTFDSLGRVENVTTPETNSISDSIKPDFTNANLLNINVKFFRNNIYIALPSESKVYIYNIEKAFWETPQTLPIRSFSIIGGELYGHSSNVDETYKMFDGYNDNGNPIKAVAKFSYQDFGDRVNLKVFDEFYSEGRIKSNTILTLKINYEFDGFETIKSYPIKGNDSAILFGKSIDNSLGKSSLGKEPIGSTTDATTELTKFRQINTIKKTDFHEMQVIYESDQIDGRWEILAFGENITGSTSMPNKIKK